MCSSCTMIDRDLKPNHPDAPQGLQLPKACTFWSELASYSTFSEQESVYAAL